MPLAEEAVAEIISQSFVNRMFLLQRFITWERERLYNLHAVPFDRFGNPVPLPKGKRRYYAYRNANEVRRARDRIVRELGKHKRIVDQYAQDDIKRLFELGAKSVDPQFTVSGNAAERLASHQAAVRNYMYSAIGNAQKSASDLPRKIAAETAKIDTYNNSLRQDQWRNKKRFARPKDLNYLGRVYKNGGWNEVAGREVVRHYHIGNYSKIVSAAEGTKAFNDGVLAAAEAKDIKYFEVVDGPDCGWLDHDDSEKANGKIVTAAEARFAPIAHPFCVRQFIPRPDIKNPKQAKKIQKELQRSKAEQILADIGSAVARKAAESAIQSAASIALNMAVDQEFRNFVFDSYINQVKNLQAMVQRMHDYRMQVIATKRGIVPTEDEVHQAVSHWVDEYMKDPQAATGAMPDYVYKILTDASKQTIIRKAGKKAAGDYLRRSLDDWSEVEELLRRRNMTHQDLNILNSIEAEYGNRFYNSLEDLFGTRSTLGQTIAEIRDAFTTRYAPNAVTQGGPGGFRPEDAARNRLGSSAARQIRGQAYRRFIKTPLDDALNRIPIIGGDGRITSIGNFLNTNRLDLLGIRYNYDSRYLQAHIDFIDKWRYYSKTKLQQVAMGRGISPDVVTKVADEKGIFTDVLRQKTKQELINTLGYSLGALGHIQVNPRGLIRLGFRFDPYAGWRYPTPRITIQPRRDLLPGFRPRFTTTLNRGTLPEGVRALERAGQNVSGLRLRTATSELAIAIGRTPLGVRRTPEIPLLGGRLSAGGEYIGAKFKTEIGQLSSYHDLPTLLTNLRAFGEGNAAKGLIKYTNVMNVFFEMRMLGWRWIRISRAFHIAPEQMQEIIAGANLLWKSAALEARMVTMDYVIRNALLLRRDDATVLQLVEQYVHLYELRSFGELQNVARHNALVSQWYQFFTGRSLAFQNKRRK